jgi:hypothetical protein
LSGFLGSTALAQALPKSCDPDDPKSCVQPLMEGEPAPFSGQLMTGRRAAKLAVLAGGCQDRVDLAVGETRELGTIDLNAEKALRASDQAAFQLQKDLLMRRMAEMEDTLAPRWYERPAFVAAVTAVVTVAVLAVSVKTVQALK